MSIAEMKWEITSSLNNLSEKALEEVLGHIKSLEGAVQYPLLDEHFSKVMEEDLNLLKRLAQ